MSAVKLIYKLTEKVYSVQNHFNPSLPSVLYLKLQRGDLNDDRIEMTNLNFVSSSINLLGQTRGPKMKKCKRKYISNLRI